MFTCGDSTTPYVKNSHAIVLNYATNMMWKAVNRGLNMSFPADLSPCKAAPLNPRMQNTVCKISITA